MSKRRTSKSIKEKIKTRHYFFLNPYNDVAFTKCPKCNNKTKVRKYPLAIHIEPGQFLCLNKICKYCPTCDLIIAKKNDVEDLMVQGFEEKDPSIIGNDYLVVGTVDRPVWRKYRDSSTEAGNVIDDIYVFKDVKNFELMPNWSYDPEK